MPTGYTAGILDGEIKDFKTFAKLCMRNFGATIHMRDDDMNAEYKPRIPSDYHTTEINKAKKVLGDLTTLSDKEVIEQRVSELLEEKSRYISYIDKANAGAVLLDKFIQEANGYTPPTSHHNSIKEFMISQLVETKNHDCDNKYWDSKLSEIESELRNIDAQSVRNKMTERAIKDLKYHEEEHRKDLIRCRESNEWVQQFLVSLK